VSSVLRVRAPATTANLGPGFDCAGAALELWNDLEVSHQDDFSVAVEGEGGGELPTDESHLAIRAFALLRSPAAHRFRFLNRIPLASGLGSSAATIALGLVAATLLDEGKPEPETLLPLALELEPHPDNLAPALAGGVCLSWPSAGGQRLTRIATTLPLRPIAVVPDARVETAAARGALPERVSHQDAAFSAGRAALLGAAIASGSAELLGEAFADRLHEPYRGRLSPVYGPIRERPPSGAAGVTISGSGPTVIVWAGPEASAACAMELAERFPASRVLELTISPTGAAQLLSGPEDLTGRPAAA
jgi:homoserine kinase